MTEGEKYALVALTVKIEGEALEHKLTPNLWVIADTSFHTRVAGDSEGGRSRIG
jgi:hypothetical protein